MKPSALALGSILILSCSSGPAAPDSTGPSSAPPGAVRCGPGTLEKDGVCVADCGAGLRSEGGTCVVDGEALVAAYSALAEEVCACQKDEACTQAVVAKRDKLILPFKPDAALRAGVAQATERFEGCVGSPIVREFAEIKDQMCECKNKECAELVNKRFEEWLKTNEAAKGSKGQQEKAKKIAEEFTKCMMTAMAGAVPPSP